MMQLHRNDIQPENSAFLKEILTKVQEGTWKYYAGGILMVVLFVLLIVAGIVSFIVFLTL
jgi:hypothetical protein